MSDALRLYSAVPRSADEAVPRIGSLLIKPVSAICNLDCSYCFYLDREADPYASLPGRRMSDDTLERLVEKFLVYSYPQSTFVFQGGEPTLAGPAFFERLCALQKEHGRSGQIVSNSLQTNGILLDPRWCALFREYHWLIGLSLDGPEEMHDRYRVDKQGRGTWRQVMRGLETLAKHDVPFNVLCVLSQANVERPKEIYAFFRSLGVEHMQFIPLAEFAPDGTPLPSSLTPEQYGRFLRGIFELWWPDRHKIHVRFFDNVRESL
ncbi:MAG: radical SAM protein, partial [Terriglobia bacterium]